MSSLNVLLVGAGYMAIEYAKVLSHLEIDFSVKGRGNDSASRFEEVVGKRPSKSWEELEAFENFSHFIVAVDSPSLVGVTQALLERGAKKLLVEKPAALSPRELQSAFANWNLNDVKLYVAYNRRFYHVVSKLMKKIEEDGGITSMHFDFSERIKIIEGLSIPASILDNWLFQNSAHVLDLVLYLTKGVSLESSATGGSLDWHPPGSTFSGLGKTSNGALFTYNSDWRAPGGWEILVRTQRRRFLLRPLETLTEVNSVGEESTWQESEETPIGLKAGILEMVIEFLSDVPNARLVTIDEQLKNLMFFSRVSKGTYS